jgi:hypothetical protein
MKTIFCVSPAIDIGRYFIPAALNLDLYFLSFGRGRGPLLLQWEGEGTSCKKCSAASPKYPHPPAKRRAPPSPKGEVKKQESKLKAVDLIPAGEEKRLI